MRNLNLDQLQTLVAIADLGTLAAAAQALHLAPPTVSLHLSELEERVGAPLIVRGRRQAELTPAGELLVRGGRHLLSQTDQLLEQARRRADGRDALVRLGTTAGVSAQLLPRVLETLAQRSPGVDIALDVLGSAEAMARIEAGTLDIGIVAMPQAGNARVTVVPWRSDPMVAWLPEGWKAPARITPAWLAQRPWMSFGPATQMHRLIAAWFGQAGLHARPRLELNHPEALRSLVAVGRGAALLPLEQPGEAPVPGLQARPLQPRLVRELGLACRATQARDAALQSVLQALAQVA